jgi:MFS family permease
MFIVLYLIGRGYSAGAAGLVLGVSGLGKSATPPRPPRRQDRPAMDHRDVRPDHRRADHDRADARTAAIIVAPVGLIGVTSQIYRPAAAAVLIDSVAATNQQRLAAFGVFRFAMNIGAALGGVLGGVLASTSYVGLFLANAAGCLLFGAVMAVALELHITGAVSRYRPVYVQAIGNLITGVGLALTGFTTGMILMSATVLIYLDSRRDDEQLHIHGSTWESGSASDGRALPGVARRRLHDLYRRRTAHRRRRVRDQAMGAVGSDRRGRTAVRPALSDATPNRMRPTGMRTRGDAPGHTGHGRPVIAE